MNRKVLLIEPKFPELFPGQELFTLQPSLGLLCLGASLEQSGFIVEILNLKVENDIKVEGCLAVGITGHAIQHKEIVKTAKKVKQQAPEIPVILGGSHATFSAEFILEQVGEIDYIIRNEGEFSFIKLLKYLEQPDLIHEIPGLSYRSESGIINNLSKKISDLSVLPLPAFHLLKLNKIFKKMDFISGELNLKESSLSIGISSSRGCTASCTFCTARLVQHPEFRVKSFDRVISEIKSLQFKLKPFLSRIDIDFVDNTFNSSKERVLTLCSLIQTNKLNFSWRCFCRSDILDDELVDSMARSGCSCVFIGAEATSNESLASVKKGITSNMTLKAVHLFEKYNISTIVSYMIGFPWEDVQNMMKTLKSALFFQNIQPTVECKIFKPTPFPGTSFWKLLEKQKLLKNSYRQLDKEIVDEFDISRRQGLTFIHPIVSEHVIDAMIVWFYLKTVKQNILYLNNKQYSDFKTGIKVRIQFLLSITKTLGGSDSFLDEISLLENQLKNFSTSISEDIDSNLDFNIEGVIKQGV